jgi:hypothetical protein
MIYTNGGNDTINPGLGSDYVKGGTGIDHLILDYSTGDTGTGMLFNGSSARRRTTSSNGVTLATHQSEPLRSL